MRFYCRLSGWGWWPFYPWRLDVVALGDLIMGVSDSLFEADTCVASNYMSRMTLMDKWTWFKSYVDNVYVVAHSRDKVDFLIDFVQMLGYNDPHLLLTRF